jgi:hypothetical protein
VIACTRCHRPLKAATPSGMGRVCASKQPTVTLVERDLFGFDVDRACDALRKQMAAFIDLRVIDEHFAVRQDVPRQVGRAGAFGMSEASSMMVALQVDWKNVPLADRDAIYRFWMEYVRGVDAGQRRGVEAHGPHDSAQRSRRSAAPLLGRAARHAVPSPTPRHPEQPVRTAGNLSERRRPARQTEAEVLACDLERRQAHARSTNFDECSEDEIREFHNRMVDRLYEPDTQEHFWPRKSPAERNATVEDVLHRQDPDEPPPTRSTARRPMTRSRNRRQHEEHA